MKFYKAILINTETNNCMPVYAVAKDEENVMQLIRDAEWFEEIYKLMDINEISMHYKQIIYT